ncbi:hypothetical protein BS78_07G189400 [Paspalum vaginatum]|nr:hypothetical protein BS78_07G189400 [Paspalum vaginatum]
MAAIGGGGGGYPGVRAGRQKHSQWTGVRLRKWGRWAAEIRLPRTRDKLWIGTFLNDRQAALAYDAAVFCLYGDHLPKTRRLNFPCVPRPEIPESARARGLSTANVKAIAERHAKAVDALLPPLVPTTAAAAAPPVAVAAAGPFDGAGAGAPAAATGQHHGNPNGGVGDGGNLMDAAVDDYSMFSFALEEFDAAMALMAPGDYY